MTTINFCLPRTRDGQRFVKREAEHLLGFSSEDGRCVITTKAGTYTAETENAAIKAYRAGKLDPVEPGDAHASLAAHKALCAAFDHFNRTLFDNRLPVPVITLHRKRGAHGYFWADQWQNGAKSRLHEIALNPETMGRDARAVLSTLVHEMVHLEQQEFGKRSSAAHNKEWADWMARIGLIPSSTGQPGGKRTGARVSHYIEEGGAYDKSYAALAATGFVLKLSACAAGSKPRTKDRTKVCFLCPECGQKAWGNHTVRLVCGYDGVAMEPQW